MNIKNQTLKQFILVSCLSAILVACTVEKKPDSADIKPDVPTTIGKDPTIILDPENIVLPPADFIPEPQQPQRQSTIPKVKPPLTKQELFAGTLEAHNVVRAKHGLKPLKWSDKLADYSQEWADHLGRGNSCQMYHRSGSPPFGENLYISTATVWTRDNKEVRREKNRVTIKNVVKAWADEEQWYNYKSNSCQPGQQCGHYTQIVWRDTTEVGCAVKFCGDQSQNWVCSYNPPGNFTGQRPY